MALGVTEKETILTSANFIHDLNVSLLTKGPNTITEIKLNKHPNKYLYETKVKRLGGKVINVELSPDEPLDQMIEKITHACK